MKKILYIASASHSGSTLLDLVLGGHSKMVGLGEVALVLEKNKIRAYQFAHVYCSCGQKMNECGFWKQALDRLGTADDLGFMERYKMVLELFEESFGPDCIPVDSSKYERYLKPLVSDLTPNNIDIKVVNLIKDVRSYTVSQIDAFNRACTGNTWKSVLKNNAYYYFWEWFLQNRKLTEYLQDSNLSVLQLGYEEFCFYPETILQMICTFAGEKSESKMVDLKGSGSHSVLGNRMRTQENKKKIQYDYRWFTRKEWQFPALLFRNIMAYNKTHVYSNNLDVIWKQ